MPKLILLFKFEIIFKFALWIDLFRQGVVPHNLVLVLSFLQIVNSPWLSDPTLQKSVGVTIIFIVMAVAFLAAVGLLQGSVQDFLALWMDNLHKVCAFLTTFFLLGHKCTPNFLGRTILVKMMAFLHVVSGVCPHASCSECNAFWSSPFWSSWESSSQWTHPSLCISPFCLVIARGLSSISILLLISRTNKRALLLTGVKFSVRSYCLCHSAGHICNRWVMRLESSRGDTSLVTEFALGLQ